MSKALRCAVQISTAAIVPMIVSSAVWAGDVNYGVNYGQGGKTSLGGQDWRDTLPAAPDDAPATLMGLFDPITKKAAANAIANPAFPGSFLIPGTNTYLRIGGYVKLDFLGDTGRNPGDFIVWGAIPTRADGVINNRTGDVRLHGRQSRFDIETRTATDWGDLKTYIEGDFFGDSGAASDRVTNPSTFAVRHAYGELGHFLAGQTWSLAMDLDSAPETLDFGGPAGFVFIRQASIRWTQPLAPGLTVAASVENPEGDFLGRAGNNAIPDVDLGGAPAFANRNLSPNVQNKVPDFVQRVSYRQSFGEISAYAVEREVTADTGTFSTTPGLTRQLANASAFGWQAGIAGVLNTIGKDNFRFEFNYGQGGARYINNFGGQSWAWNGAGIIEPQTVYGGYLYYQHWWTSMLRTNIGAGAVHAINDVNIIGPIVTALQSAVPQNPTRDAVGGHVNLIWSPVPNTNFGIEYANGYRVEESGDKGRISRFQFSVQYLF